MSMAIFLSILIFSELYVEHCWVQGKKKTIAHFVLGVLAFGSVWANYILDKTEDEQLRGEITDLQTENGQIEADLQEAQQQLAEFEPRVFTQTQVNKWMVRLSRYAGEEIHLGFVPMADNEPRALAEQFHKIFEGAGWEPIQRFRMPVTNLGGQVSNILIEADERKESHKAVIEIVAETGFDFHHEQQDYSIAPRLTIGPTVP